MTNKRHRFPCEDIARICCCEVCKRVSATEATFDGELVEPAVVDFRFERFDQRDHFDLFHFTLKG
jgi:hypothetical protein